MNLSYLEIEAAKKVARNEQGLAKNWYLKFVQPELLLNL
jgi:hypothetical protein